MNIDWSDQTIGRGRQRSNRPTIAAIESYAALIPLPPDSPDNPALRVFRRLCVPCTTRNSA